MQFFHVDVSSFSLHILFYSNETISRPFRYLQLRINDFPEDPSLRELPSFIGGVKAFHTNIYSTLTKTNGLESALKAIYESVCGFKQRPCHKVILSPKRCYTKGGPFHRVSELSIHDH